MLSTKFVGFLLLLCSLNIFSIQPEEQLLVDHVIKSIEEAEQENSKLNNNILHIPGMSSPKVRHLLNNICSLPGARYLEIGSWKGSTFISALYGNKETLKEAFSIDNWSECGIAREDFLINTNKFLSNNPFTLYEANCFSLNLRECFTQSINIYFYDGNHLFQSQKLAFQHFNAIFEDTFIAIVDDYNWEQVSSATQEVFKELKYKILFDKYLISNFDNKENEWWNGLYIAVISKNK